MFWLNLARKDPPVQLDPLDLRDLRAQLVPLVLLDPRVIPAIQVQQDLVVPLDRLVRLVLRVILESQERLAQLGLLDLLVLPGLRATRVTLALLDPLVQRERLDLLDLKATQGRLVQPVLLVLLAQRVLKALRAMPVYKVRLDLRVLLGEAPGTALRLTWLMTPLV